MKFLGNLIWLLFGGFFLALGYILAGVILCITIIGIPFGIQLIRIGSFVLWPFGRVVRSKERTVGCLSTFMNVLWIFFFGLYIALGHVVIGAVFCLTIIGIPFGMQHFKLAAIALTPFGHEVVSECNI